MSATGKRQVPPTISKCRSCNAPIRWGKSIAGKTVPIDISPTEVDGEWRYLSHFQTCPQASQWSKR